MLGEGDRPGREASTTIQGSSFSFSLLRRFSLVGLGFSLEPGSSEVFGDRRGVERLVEPSFPFAAMYAS
jgi:hypothetical protein